MRSLRGGDSREVLDKMPIKSMDQKNKCLQNPACPNNDRTCLIVEGRELREIKSIFPYQLQSCGHDISLHCTPEP